MTAAIPTIAGEALITPAPFDDAPKVPAELEDEAAAAAEPVADVADWAAELLLVPEAAAAATS